jgi:hypothetical protein
MNFAIQDNLIVDNAYYKFPEIFLGECLLL